MTQRLPPLNPLRVFAAVARTSNLTVASRELNVTQSAVSRQIGVLEDYLGVQLLKRERHGVSLTAVGRSYADRVVPAFDELVLATEQITNANDGKILRVRTYTTIAAKFLIPRLNDFKLRHPDIDVELIIGVPGVDFARDMVDVAIQFGDGRWPAMRADLLFCDEIEPVCAPQLLSRSGGADARALLKQRLLVSHYRRSDWDDWLSAAGLTGVDAAAERMVFSSSVLTWQAALDGLGIAIGQTALLRAELASNRLVRPFGRPLRRDMGHYLLRPAGTRESRRVKLFREWILSTLDAYAGT